MEIGYFSFSIVLVAKTKIEVQIYKSIACKDMNRYFYSLPKCSKITTAMYIFHYRTAI
jgi:hypothetical protein